MTTSINCAERRFDRVADLPLLLTRREVAQLARCCVRSVIRAEKREQLPAVRQDGRVRYRRSDVLRWVGLDEETAS